MLRQSSVARMRAELGALEASAERAGTALACVYSSAEEFEAAEIGARRAAGSWKPYPIDGLRLLLGAPPAGRPRRHHRGGRCALRRAGGAGGDHALASDRHYLRT